MHRSKIPGLLVTVLFFIASSGKAQSPGYMGKKIIAGYGFYIDPAFGAVITGYGSKIVNIQHEFFLEYVISKKYMIGFSGKLYKSTYNNTANVVLDNSSYFPSAYGLPGDHPGGSYSITARNFQLYAKWFRSNYLAPWGKYFMCGITLNAYDCTYDPNQMQVQFSYYNNNAPSVPYNNFGPTFQSYQYADLMLGAGHSRIFWNKLVVDYGYNMNLLATLLPALDIIDFTTPDVLGYIKKTSTERVRGINRFNFFIKVGYLF
jgi:hypothetical protein